jgi:8-oxo-dGTP pyrophosphatase MutT (NUDIX family)
MRPAPEVVPVTGWLGCPGGRPHWGERGAAGLLPVTAAAGQPCVLLCLRSALTDAAWTWGTAGGAIEAGETPWDAAVREAAEEIGLPAFRRAAGHTARCPHCPWEYTTFPVRVGTPAPVAADCAEVIRTAWIQAGNLTRLRLHPGLARAWDEGLAALAAGTALEPGPGAWDADVWALDRGWFHGGVAGLDAGDLILPPAETGASGSSYDPPGYAWVTTDVTEARMFARKCAGDVYQVIPRGLVTASPPEMTGLAATPPWARDICLAHIGLTGTCICRSALVVRAVARGLRPDTVQVLTGDGLSAPDEVRRHYGWRPAATPVTTDPVPVTTSEAVPVTTSDPVPVTTTDPVPVTTSEAVPVTTSEAVPVTTSEAAAWSTLMRDLAAYLAEHLQANGGRYVLSLGDLCTDFLRSRRRGGTTS